MNNPQLDFSRKLVRLQSEEQLANKFRLICLKKFTRDELHCLELILDLRIDGLLQPFHQIYEVLPNPLKIDIMPAIKFPIVCFIELLIDDGLEVR